MKHIVVVACHFESPTKLCKTTITRLHAALKMSDKGDQIIVTGDVPYKSGGLKTTLAKLMKAWLVDKGFPAERISISRDGVGTFSEARLTCELLNGVGEIFVISSGWYLFQGKPIWCRRGKENGIKVSFVPVSGTGGRRTVLLYTIIGVAVRAAILLGVESILENRLTASQESRKKGFTFDGCR